MPIATMEPYIGTILTVILIVISLLFCGAFLIPIINDWIGRSNGRGDK